MLQSQAISEQAENVRVAAILVMAAIFVFRRVLLKVLLVLVAIATVVGAVTLLQMMRG